MADVNPADTTASQGPAQPSERIIAIDVLRGVALLGILIMNIQAFAMIFAAYLNPTAYGDLTGVNYLVWLLGHLLADQKFMTIFAMLFGAGVVLLTERQAQAGGKPARYHYRRTIVLILIGLLHAYMLWDGDILVTYGICALVVYFFRRLSPRWLLPAGFLLLCVPSVIYLVIGLSLPSWPEEILAEMKEGWQPGPDTVAAEVAAYQGGWLRQMDFRVPGSVSMETFVLAIWGFWRAAGLMLIGMACYKIGVFSATLPRRYYLGIVGLGLLVGLPLEIAGVLRNEAHGWDLSCMFQGSVYNYWGSLGVSLAWISLVMLLCQSGRLRPLQTSLAAVGRTALSNYLLQTLLCTTLFYGHGFGLFGKVSRMGQLGIVLAIWALQLLVSPLWLRFFAFGPAEWVWRCATYWRLQPFLRPGLMVHRPVPGDLRLGGMPTEPGP
jgi:uncharacterized protein